MKISILLILIELKIAEISCSMPFQLLDDGLDMKLPFKSLIEPKFPKLVRREIKLNPIKTQLEKRYSVHKLTIVFTNCTKNYEWGSQENVLIISDKNHPTAIFVRYDYRFNKINKCILTSFLKVSYNLHGYPLMVIYENNYKRVIEASYPIHFQFADLQLRLDKLFYKTFDEIRMRCTLLTPWKYLFNGRLKIIPSNSNLTIYKETYLNNDFVLEVIGKITAKVFLLNVTCRFADIFVVKTVPIVAYQGYQNVLIIEYSALKICLSFFLISLIIWGIYTLIIGGKRRLIYDVTAYHTECVEDRTIRFWDPILNNLTSPVRKYAVPGALTVFLLRRNVNRLFSKLFSIYPKSVLPTLHGDTALVEMERERERIISKKFNPLLSSPLGNRVIQALGPQPMKKPIYLTPPFPNLPPLVTNLPQEQSEYPVVESHVLLDRQTVSGLPYISIAQTTKSPCWSVKDTLIPIQYGVTYNESP